MSPLYVCTLFLIIRFISTEVIIKEMTESNWKNMLNGEWIVKFYAPWCPACRALEAPWEEFASWGHDLNLNVSQIDVTKNPGLSGRFLITMLPTIYHIKDGIFRKVKNLYDKDRLVSFIQSEEWKDIRPLSFWFSPSSCHMSILSCFFKFSMMLRDLHNYLIEIYGLPTWTSYAIFIIMTVLLGTFMGLAIVYITDHFSCFGRKIKVIKPKSSQPHPKKNDDYQIQDIIKKPKVDGFGDSGSKEPSSEEGLARRHAPKPK